MARFDVGDGRSVYFEHHRGEKLPVVLIHGWAMSGRIWAGTVEALKADGHAVIVVDHRGCGQSDRDFDDLSVGAIASDVAADAVWKPVFLTGGRSVVQSRLRLRVCWAIRRPVWS